MPDVLLEARGVEAGYANRQILRGVDLSVDTGDVVALLGANGSGKSTLLNVLSGFLRPRHGSILLQRTELAGLRPHRIFRHGIVQVSQSRDLFPEMSVEENLRLGGWVRRADLARLLDEPSGGLAPAFVTEIAAIVSALKRQRVTMVIVEQNIRLAMSVADRILILRDGRVVEHQDLRVSALDEEQIVRQIYL